MTVLSGIQISSSCLYLEAALQDGFAEGDDGVSGYCVAGKQHAVVVVQHGRGEQAHRVLDDGLVVDMDVFQKVEQRRTDDRAGDVVDVAQGNGDACDGLGVGSSLAGGDDIEGLLGFRLVVVKQVAQNNRFVDNGMHDASLIADAVGFVAAYIGGSIRISDQNVGCRDKRIDPRLAFAAALGHARIRFQYCEPVSLGFFHRRMDFKGKSLPSDAMGHENANPVGKRHAHRLEKRFRSPLFFGIDAYLYQCVFSHDLLFLS